MASRVHRISRKVTGIMKVRLWAERIYLTVEVSGARQVRLHHGELLTYPFPAKRGYGTRGVLLGIYDAGVRPEWIEEDLLEALSGESDA